MQWHNAATKTPEKSGDYLIAIKHVTDYGYRQYDSFLCYVSEYDVKHGFSFNERMEKIGSEQRVYAWAEIADVPKF